MRRLLISLLTIASLTESAHAESETGTLNVSAQVMSHCSIDMRSAGDEPRAPLDLRCGDAMPLRVESTAVQTLLTDGDADRFVVTTVNF